MLDIKMIRENLDAVKKGVTAKGVNINFDELIELDDKRKSLLGEVEQLKAERNKASKMIAVLKKEKKDASSAIEETRVIGDKISVLDKQVKENDENIRNIMLSIPNVPHESVPFGKDETENVSIRSWGEKREFDFKAKDHLQIAEDLDIIDFKRASKISGSGFPLYKGKGAILERALINYMLDFHSKNGFTEVMPPIMALPVAMEGTSQLPKMEEDMYYMEKDNLYMIPTAEVTITNMYREETLRAEDLPMYFAGYSPCFRREAGSYGKDTRGLLRLHQFNKVEMVKYVKPEDSMSELEDLVVRVETILKELKIPYHVLTLCTGDLSFGCSKCYDVETWAPAEGKYLEVSSCSKFDDFQARRMNLRFKRDSKSRPEFIHTLNGSGIATPRLMVSILETYQNEDGSITIPEVLRRYTGFDKIER